MVNIDLMPFKC